MLTPGLSMVCLVAMFLYVLVLAPSGDLNNEPYGENCSDVHGKAVVPWDCDGMHHRG